MGTKPGPAFPWLVGPVPKPADRGTADYRRFQWLAPRRVDHKVYLRFLLRDNPQLAMGLRWQLDVESYPRHDVYSNQHCRALVF